ncbi:hypothetical protein QBC35DRAFT_262000 [Podospora australis]|uniref:Uncharacterized protein n=1 Tax=Podospora australis TaxID=1536484 RepID=A0AAN6X2C2_9PEZI|nr:hypothetical protein QBC35DRAFT_262000 [Podospora australis]
MIPYVVVPAILPITRTQHKCITSSDLWWSGILSYSLRTNTLSTHRYSSRAQLPRTRPARQHHALSGVKNSRDSLAAGRAVAAHEGPKKPSVSPIPNQPDAWTPKTDLQLPSNYRNWAGQTLPGQEINGLDDTAGQRETDCLRRFANEDDSARLDTTNESVLCDGKGQPTGVLVLSTAWQGSPAPVERKDVTLIPGLPFHATRWSREPQPGDECRLNFLCLADW